jgi:hypothetical protein
MGATRRAPSTPDNRGTMEQAIDAGIGLRIEKDGAKSAKNAKSE